MKKKSQKEELEPSSNEISESTIIVSDSTNTAIVTGNNNRVIQKAGQPKPMEVLPYEGNERLLWSFGRWLMRTFFHGDMKHSLKMFTAIISVLTIVETYFTFGRIYLDSDFLAALGRSTINLYEEIGWLLGFALTLTFGWGTIEISRKTTCPKCGQKFMFTRKSRFVIGQGVHHGNEVTNYKSNYSCDNCGYKESNVPEVVERELSTTEE